MQQPVFIRKKYVDSFMKELKERQKAANAKVEADAKAIFDKLTDEA